MASLIWICFVSILSMQGGEALDWLSGQSLPDGTRLSGCAGNDVQLPWNYSTTGPEHVVDVEWYYQPTGQDSKHLLATWVAGNFLATPLLKGEHLENAGIRLTNLSKQDEGVYSVLINVNLDGSMTSQSQNVTLEVAEPPIVWGGSLHARLTPEAVYREASRTWHPQLACGPVHDLGSPPISVVWQTPTQGRLSSTSQENGTFYLALPIPTATGNYTCFLADSPSAQCLELGNNGGPIQPAVVSVDGLDVRMTVMEAEMRKQSSLQEQLISNLTHQVEVLSQDNQNLTQQVSSLTHLVSDLTQENANMTEQLSSLASKCPQNLDSNLDVLSSCANLSETNSSGTYNIIDGNSTFRVLCDQETDGGGWTIFQRRINGRVDFYRNWKDYENGFGDINGDYWIGLKHIYDLTSRRPQQLRVDLEAFDGVTAYAKYSHFNISGPEDKYRLHLSGYTGTAGDVQGLSYNNGHQFSTRDRDVTGHCTLQDRGGWWYNSCAFVNLNGLYKGQGNGSESSESSVQWYDFRRQEALKWVEMKIKPA